MPRSATTSGATGAMLWNCIAMVVRARKMIAMMNQRCRKTEPVMSGASARQDPRTTTRNGGLGSMSTRRRGAGRSHAGEGVARRLLVLRGEHAHERAPDGFPRAPSEDPLGHGVPARDRAATADGDECVACRAHHLLQGALGLRRLAVEPRVADGHREGVREHLEQLALARIDGSRARPVGDDQVAHDGGVIADGTDDGALGLHALRQEIAQDHLRLVVAEGLLELHGDACGELGQIELAQNAAGDLAQDGELGHPQGLLRLLAARLFLEGARLGGDRPHLVHEAAELAGLAQLGLASGEGPAHRLLEIAAAEGLDQVLKGAVGEGVLDGVEGGVGSDHHRLDGGIHRLDALEQLDAVHPRHLDVHEYQIGMEGGEGRERRLPAVRGDDLVAGLENHPQGFPGADLVVHHQDPRAITHGWVVGRVTEKVTSARPCLTSRRPPCASRMRWLTQGPTSMRFSWTTWMGSKMRSSSSGLTSAVRDATVTRTGPAGARDDTPTAILAS